MESEKKETYTYGFPMAGNTATMVLYNPAKGEVLLGLRKADSDAFPNRWSLPGGYLNVGTETMLRAASRETEEETMLIVDEPRWIMFYVDDEVGSDPRYSQVINLCYFVNVTNDESDSAEAGDDLQEVKWVKVAEALTIDLPFNHNAILKEFAIGTPELAT